ncbi:SAF domain-containing protein [Rhabdothermincola salaria]|uniref:SAF domain-containing protein n=1 Tax=Rhabdothermincola salaria TaxID=2903142 RepID=UPI001E374C89|nr:SAF domain-containing protein [Rhabdothermincola salaria]MCD9623782.1 hypothetical protein [Rhabdothermincola salaria]
MGTHLAGPDRRRVRRGRRRPLIRWAATVVAALVAGALAAGAVARADAARAAYGTLREVPVALRSLAVGDVVGPADVEIRALPEVMVPEGVAEDPLGRAVGDAIVAGEVVLDARLAGWGTGPAARLEPGQRALAVPVDDRSLVLQIGDRVDVLAPEVGSTTGARRVARGAEVLAVDALTVTVAVDASAAPAVGRAVLDGAVVLALVGAVP